MPELDCRNCRECKNYKDCPSYHHQDGEVGQWFDYAEIRFCVYQCLWVRRHAKILWAGRWPQDPCGPNDESVKQHMVKTEASFIKPELIIGEVEARLSRCGRDAEKLVTQIEDGRTFNTLSSGAREVLMYIKGLRRKKRRVGFRRWVREVYYSSSQIRR